MLIDLVIIVSAFLLFGMYKVFQTSLPPKKRNLIIGGFIFFIILNIAELVADGVWLYVAIPNFLLTVLFAVYIARQDKKLLYVFAPQVAFSVFMLVFLCWLYYSLATMTHFGF